MLEKLQELLVSVARLALGDHLAGGDIQGREQRWCAVANVVASDAFDLFRARATGAAASALTRLSIAPAQSRMAHIPGHPLSCQFAGVMKMPC